MNIANEPSPLHNARPVVQNSSDPGRVTVVGLGNILLTDEGAGVNAVNALKESYSFEPDVELIDGGTMGLDLLPLFQERERIIIIDAVDFGKPPGHVGVIEGKDIPTVLNTKLSVHHIGLSDVLFAAKLMRETQLEVFLVGIQPKSLDVGYGMTGEVRAGIAALIEHTLQKLKDWNVSCALQSPRGSSL